MLVVLMLVALAQAIFQIHHITGVTQRFATGDMQRLLRVQALSLQTEGVGNALIRLINAPRESRVVEYADVDERNRRIDGIIESLTNDLKDADQEQNLKRLVECRAAYAEAFIATADEIEGDNPAGAWKLLNERVNPALKTMLLESNALLQRERERLAWQIGELENLSPGDSEWEGLNTSHTRYSNAQSLLEAAEGALAALEGEEAGASSQLSRARALVGQARPIGPDTRRNAARADPGVPRFFRGRPRPRRVARRGARFRQSHRAADRRGA